MSKVTNPVISFAVNQILCSTVSDWLSLPYGSSNASALKLRNVFVLPMCELQKTNLSVLYHYQVRVFTPPCFSGSAVLLTLKFGVVYISECAAQKC